MTDPSLGTWLRRERERRGITLRTIAEHTKLAVPLLEGLENDDLARWPGGIYRRAFVRAYAAAVGLDADDIVARFEAEHGPAESSDAPDGAPVAGSAVAVLPNASALAPSRTPAAAAHASRRARIIGTAADLGVALVLGFACAAADSRLLWPVLAIATYYACGVLITGTSPMVALLNGTDAVAAAPPVESPRQEVAMARPQPERRHHARRGGNRPARSSRQARPRVQ